MTLLHLLTEADFNRSRIVIAESEITDTGLTMWLEDKWGLALTLDDCVQVEISMADFERVIRVEMRANGEPHGLPELEWYELHASTKQQEWCREAVLAILLDKEVAV